MLTKRGLKYCSEDSGLLESCTYIGSQNSPHIVLLLWPKVDRVYSALQFIVVSMASLPFYLYIYDFRGWPHENAKWHQKYRNHEKPLFCVFGPIMYIEVRIRKGGI